MTATRTKLQVNFTVDVEYLEHDSPLMASTLLQDSVAEAISNAVLDAQGEGFSHLLEHDISIMLDTSSLKVRVAVPYEVKELAKP